MKEFIKDHKTIESTKKIISKIKNSLKDNKDKNKTELTYENKEKILELYDNVYKPTFKPCYAVDTFVKKEFEDMKKTLFNDIGNIIDDLDSLNEDVSIKTSDIEIYRNNMYNSNRLTDKTLNTIKDDIYNFSELKVSTIIESFDNADGKGYLTLPYKSYNDLSSSAIIEVLDTNGFPGNTHVATQVYSNTIYEGEFNPMINLDNLVDGNIDTRFDLEIFNIDEEIYENVNGAGFTYKEGCSYISNDNSLFLKMRISFSSNKISNWFSIAPYIPASPSFNSATIKSIIISDGNNKVKKLTENIDFSDAIIIPYEDTSIRYIDLVIEQNMSYPVTIAHDVITKVNKKNNYFDKNNIKTHERLNMPIRTVSSLGMEYDVKNKKNIINKSNDKLATKGNSSNLFIPLSIGEEYEHSLEILDANRYCISICSINVGNYIFDDEYSYISKEYVYKNSINSIVFNANDSIDDENIKYYISIDHGHTWIRLYPKERAFNGSCCVEVNSIVPLYKRDDKIIYVDTLMVVNSVIVKIELTKPKDNSKIPIVYDYKLNVEIGEEYLWD